MQLIRYTTKLLKEIRLKPKDLQLSEPAVSFLGKMACGPDPHRSQKDTAVCKRSHSIQFYHSGCGAASNSRVAGTVSVNALLDWKFLEPLLGG